MKSGHTCTLVGRPYTCMCSESILLIVVSVRSEGSTTTKIPYEISKSLDLQISDMISLISD